MGDYTLYTVKAPSTWIVGLPMRSEPPTKNLRPLVPMNHHSLDAHISMQNVRLLVSNQRTSIPLRNAGIARERTGLSHN